MIRFMQPIKRVGTRNPVFMPDEVDSIDEALEVAIGNTNSKSKRRSVHQ